MRFAGTILKSTKVRFLLWYGVGLGTLLLLMSWAKYRLLMLDYTLELYGLLVAVVFVGVGIWVGLRWSRPVPQAVAATLPDLIQPTVRPEELGISPREMDVLGCLAKGMSNDEIADQLFVSTNTVKTHLSNLYVKLDVKRRTQAVERARMLGLIG